MKQRQKYGRRRYSRRRFIVESAAGIGGIVASNLLLEGCTGEKTPEVAESPWARASAILDRVRPPEFSNRDFVVTDFGAAAADAGTGGLITGAIHSAIEACVSAGGGRVVIPPGDFETGAITLQSNVNLHVSEGATLRFSRSPDQYLPARFSRWEGVELMNYSPLIYAFEATNVAISGKGTIDGQADEEHWWPWKGKPEFGWKEGEPNQLDARSRLFDQAKKGTPVEERRYGEGDFLRPNLVQFYRCTNVLIEDAQFIRSPMWVLHPVLSRNVTIRRVTVDSHGPNNDGCDVESCTDVLIEDCLFDTGDDCIVMKSGRNEDGRRLAAPVENVVIRRCMMRDGHGGVVIGSEISGGAMNIFAEDCTMKSPRLDRVLRIKTNSVRGGRIEGVFIRNVAADAVTQAVVSVNFYYEEGDTGTFSPELADVVLEEVTCAGGEYGLYLRGYEDSPIRGVTLRNCRFDNIRNGNVLEHVDGLVLDHVYINGERLG